MSQAMTIYQKLHDRYGPRHWWPAETPFEMAVGAILTQNTNWKNVEKAIANLRLADCLSVAAISALPPEELEELIRPSGFFRQKGERLRLFSDYLGAKHRSSLEQMLQQPLEPLRKELLGLKGIGPETADSILLYAGGHLSFVIDAYTLRIFSRLGLFGGQESYTEARHFFMTQLPPQAPLYNQYHALIVEHAKRHCLKRPRCIDCPLADDCRYLLARQTDPELV